MMALNRAGLRLAGGIAIWLGTVALGTLALGAFAGWRADAMPSPSPGSSGDSGPRLEVDQTIRDLGASESGESWSIPFELRNTGARRLVVNQMNLDCHCDDFSKPTILILPGRSATVHVTLDARHQSGPVEAEALFSTNDPRIPELRLLVRSNVRSNEEMSALQVKRDRWPSVLIAD